MFHFELAREGARKEEDKVIWIGSKNGKFPTKALYSALESKSTTSFPTSVIWNSWIPPKVGFFAWEAT